MPSWCVCAPYAHVPAGTTGQGLVDLLKQLNRRSRLFDNYASVILDKQQQEQQQGQQQGQQQQRPDRPQRCPQQLRCLKIGPPADDHQLQQQQCGEAGPGAGWRVTVFAQVKRELLPGESPLLEGLQVLELHGLSTAQQAEVGGWPYDWGLHGTQAAFGCCCAPCGDPCCLQECR